MPHRIIIPVMQEKAKIAVLKQKYAALQSDPNVDPRQVEATRLEIEQRQERILSGELLEDPFLRNARSS